MKKKFSAALGICLLLCSSSFTACNLPGLGSFNENVLRVASWDEYIDMGGEVYADEDAEDFIAWYYETFGIELNENTKPLYEEFVDWYHREYKDKEGYKEDFEKVEYVALQDNETMYNKIKMGDQYDLLCPSEYMAIKLKNEGRLQAYSADFFEKSNPLNYYAQNLSPYVDSVLSNPNVGLKEYLAGYMWGTTGFVFNPDKIGKTKEESREIMSSWHCMTTSECARKITAKDNARDSYFMGLGMYYEETLLALDKNATNYASELARLMNDTTPQTVNGVRECLRDMRENIYGLETDEAKTDMIMGWLDASYQWSGDAVFILDEAESESNLELEYSIPSSASNIWFDGWVMMDGADEHISTAFINFLSLPQNVVRNMYYIGYTSCMAGNEVYQYADYSYGDENGDAEYSLSYFFGEEYAPLTVSSNQLRRQLFAQYPDEETTKRLVVMKPFEHEDNERVNRMWINIK
ncbi:MAG: extracellular solute-binding protein [Clostridia bacterium]|nr:extracellular solute-binding protein [Clostridia bacterium]